MSSNNITSEVSLTDANHDFSGEGKFSSDTQSVDENKAKCGLCKSVGFWVSISSCILGALLCIIGIFMMLSDDKVVNTVGSAFMISSICIPVFILLCYGGYLLTGCVIEKYRASRVVSL